MAVKQPTRCLVLVRHSAVQINQDLSSHEWTLSPEGRARCWPLAKSLSPYNISRFISSEEPKATETTQLMSGFLNVPQRIAPGLQEHNRTGAPYFKSNPAFREAIEELFTHPDKLVFGQETAVQALTRFKQAVYREIERRPIKSNANPAIVTHGTVLTLFVCHHNPTIDPMTFWNSLEMPCAVILNYPDLSFVSIIQSPKNRI